MRLRRGEFCRNPVRSPGESHVRNGRAHVASPSYAIGLAPAVEFFSIRAPSTSYLPRQQCSPPAVSSWSPASSCTSIDGMSSVIRLFSSSPSSRYLGDALAYYTGSSTIAACLILAGSLIAVVLALGNAIVPHLKFIWHCFLRPLGATDQRTRLDKVHTLPSPISLLISTTVLQGPSRRVRQDSEHPPPRPQHHAQALCQSPPRSPCQESFPEAHLGRHWRWHRYARSFFSPLHTHRVQVTTSSSWTSTFPSPSSTPSTSSISVNLS